MTFVEKMLSYLIGQKAALEEAKASVDQAIEENKRSTDYLRTMTEKMRQTAKEGAEHAVRSGDSNHPPR